jgi:hypothetical protein
MVFAEFDRQARVRHALRIKLAVQMLTTFSYGALGLAAADPVLGTKAFSAGHLASAAFGLVCAFAALYLSPEGERDGVF